MDKRLNFLYIVMLSFLAFGTVMSFLTILTFLIPKVFIKFAVLIPTILNQEIKSTWDLVIHNWASALSSLLIAFFIYIYNVDDFKRFPSKDSFLQIVFLPAGLYSVLSTFVCFMVYATNTYSTSFAATYTGMYITTWVASIAFFIYVAFKVKINVKKKR